MAGISKKIPTNTHLREGFQIGLGKCGGFFKNIPKKSICTDMKRVSGALKKSSNI